MESFMAGSRSCHALKQKGKKELRYLMVPEGGGDEKVIGQVGRGFPIKDLVVKREAAEFSSFS